MSACEKCWKDAFDRDYSEPTRSHYEHYQDLLAERKDNPCTELEQKGELEEKENEKSHEVFNSVEAYMKVFDKFILRINP